MAKYEVDIQADTVKKLKNMIGIGTIDDSKYVITTNGTHDVDDFIEYTQVNVAINDVNIDLAPADRPLSVTALGPLEIVHQEVNSEGITVYTGYKAIDVDLVLTEVTSLEKIYSSMQVEGNTEAGNTAVGKLITTVASNTDKSVLQKETKFTIFDGDDVPGATNSLNISKPMCVSRFNINEIEDYNELVDLEVTATPLDPDVDPETVIFAIAGNACDTEGLRKHPLSGTFTTTIDALNVEFAKVGYILVPVETQEL